MGWTGLAGEEPKPYLIHDFLLGTKMVSNLNRSCPACLLSCDFIRVLHHVKDALSFLLIWKYVFVDAAMFTDSLPFSWSSILELKRRVACAVDTSHQLGLCHLFRIPESKNVRGE